MTQNEMILDYLNKYGSITQAEAANRFGCWRLGARIWDLKHMGHQIRRTMVQSTNRFGAPVSFAKYSLERKNDKNDGEKQQKGAQN